MASSPGAEDRLLHSSEGPAPSAWPGQSQEETDGGRSGAGGGRGEAELGGDAVGWSRAQAAGPRGHPCRPPRPPQVQSPRLPANRLPVRCGQGRAPAGVWAAEERSQGTRLPRSAQCGVSTEGPALGFGSTSPPPFEALGRSRPLSVCSSSSFITASCLKPPPWTCPTGAAQTRGASEAGRWPRGGAERRVGRPEFGWFVRVGLLKAGQVEARGAAEARWSGGEPSS